MKFKLLYIVIGIAVVLVVGAASYQFLIPKEAVSSTHTSHTGEEYLAFAKARFIDINQNRNSACFGSAAVMQMPDDGKIRGSCCGPMSLHTYGEQLEAIEKNYAGIDFIPKDPYDIDASQAKELISDFKTIKLTPEQQQTYEDAKKISHEGGPCCCGDDVSETSCWRWRMMGGAGKKAIVELGFSAQQVADLWDISDGCGGDHHLEGVHE